MSDMVEVESKHAPPLAECVNCGHMLPPGLGEVFCEVCGAGCKVSHEPTIKALQEEKVPCPHCHTILVAGTEDRPVDLSCGACSREFTLTPKIVKVEIDCPGCERILRIRPKPGKRQLNCPACDSSFHVTF
tara:strand:+ start:16509 stop:16901 length:393 start_codon:yes stop_codon:yes gene_type:complete